MGRRTKEATPLLERFKAWVATPVGGKVVPIVSAALVVVGVLLAGMSLFSGSSPTPTPTPVVSTATQDLTKALAAAKVYLLQQHPHSYKDFGAAAATDIDGTLTWKKGGPATTGEISIRVGGPTQIVLVTKDTSGTVYCIADVNGDEKVTQGKDDAKTPGKCKGGW